MNLHPALLFSALEDLLDPIEGVGNHSLLKEKNYNYQSKENFLFLLQNIRHFFVNCYIVYILELLWVTLFRDCTRITVIWIICSLKLTDKLEKKNKPEILYHRLTFSFEIVTAIIISHALGIAKAIFWVVPLVTITFVRTRWLYILRCRKKMKREQIYFRNLIWHESEISTQLTLTDF